MALIFLSVSQIEEDFVRQWQREASAQTEARGLSPGAAQEVLGIAAATTDQRAASSCLPPLHSLWSLSTRYLSEARTLGRH